MKTSTLAEVGYQIDVLKRLEDDQQINITYVGPVKCPNIVSLVAVVDRIISKKCRSRAHFIGMMRGGTIIKTGEKFTSIARVVKDPAQAASLIEGHFEVSLVE